MTRQVPKTVHGTALVLGNTGLFIRGPSGSGKSRLAQILIDQWNSEDRHSIWVADDRVILTGVGGTTIARPPAALAGMYEQRFMGLENTGYEKSARLDMIVDLVPTDELERMPVEGLTSLIEDTSPLPVVKSPANDAPLAAEIVRTAIFRLDQ